MIQLYINLFLIKTKENLKKSKVSNAQESKIGTLFPTLLDRKERQRATLGKIK